MIPTSFEGETHVAGPPEGMTEEEVHSLSVAHVNYDGQPATISCWKMTHEEMEEFQRTGRIWMVQMGHRVFPHLLTGHNPFH